MDISNQIRRHRTERGLSQEELARRLYVSRNTISNWECGRTYPDAQSLMLMSALFDVSIDSLVKGDLPEMREMVESWEARAMLALEWVVWVGVGLLILVMVVGSRLWGPIVLLATLPFALLLTMVDAALESWQEEHDIYAYREALDLARGKDPGRGRRGAWTRFVAAFRALGPWVRMLLLWGFFRGASELAMPLVLGILDALGI
ncbi:XRE family transcriptional regulator [Olsenella sp. SW781]|uniref:helix-turn-helix domain-containing protein n=1 Tax=Olsenella sp. SW781 TaxID=2530046 RepID=UPI0014392DCA|nr:XRE family transcriptional regulator [Olsenella sp. SW781]